MKNYEKLKSIIQKANPEIMELKFGCHIKTKDGMVGIVERTFAPAPGEEFGRVKTFTHGELAIGSFQKLGRPIRLADVLLAMSSQGVITQASPRLFNIEDLGDDIYSDVRWNLKDDNLDHQSDETKQFLIDLLIQPS